MKNNIFKKTRLFVVYILATAFVKLISNLKWNYFDENVEVSNKIFVSLIYDSLIFGFVIVLVLFIIDYFTQKKRKAQQR